MIIQCPDSSREKIEEKKGHFIDIHAKSDFPCCSSHGALSFFVWFLAIAIRMVYFYFDPRPFFRGFHAIFGNSLILLLRLNEIVVTIPESARNKNIFHVPVF